MFVAVAVVAAASISTVLFFPASQPEPPRPIQRDYQGDIALDGATRSYLVHLPTEYDGQRRLPVLVAFHGGDTNAEGFRDRGGLNEVADRRGFIAVYPEGFGTGERDVRFTAILIEQLAGELQIDSNRVYVTGFSLGAELTYRIGCELADRIAGIATMGANMYGGLARCHPQRPIAAVVLHGTNDVFVGDGLALADTLETWARVNGCTMTPTVETRTSVRQETYGGCRDDTTVVLYDIIGLAHAWPRPPNYPEGGELIWDVFEQAAR